MMRGRITEMDEPHDIHAAPDPVAAVVERQFGFAALRPLQREAIDAALAGRDLLTVLPTGGGKSLCYQAPPLVTGKLTIVVSPLIALMQDQVDGLRVHGYPAAALHSNVDAATRDRVVRDVEAGRLKLLLVAPERLLLDGFLRWLAGCEVGAIAIDEAHCISQWGHDFRPEYRRLAELRPRFPGVPFHGYTATATPRVREDIVAQLGLVDPVVLVGTFDRPNLTYRVLPRVDRSKQVLEAIGRHPGAAAIVYCLSRKDTEGLAQDLKSAGVVAAPYHAGLDAAVRTRVSEDFRADRLDVVVATVAFGMGIDRGDVRLVVHAAMPRSVEHYQQETGRAGRDGLPAECLLLYSGADAARWASLVERSATESAMDAATLAVQMALLQQMQRIARGSRCRHRVLSEYFGQDYPKQNCGACDLCLDELAPVDDAHVVTQKILSAVARCGQRYGTGHVVDVLRGRKTAKVVERGHDRIPTFGLLGGLSAQRLANYVDQLVDAGDLARSTGEYPVLTLTHASLEVLRGERRGELVEPKFAAAEPASGSGRKRGRDKDRGRDLDLDDAERERFESLRVLRRTIAAEIGLPPYIVFGDATLVEMVRARPRTLTEMLRVHGVGKQKLDAFGERFLAEIAGWPERTRAGSDE